MRIAVLSDTHITENKCALPENLVRELKKSDLIIHAGDLVEPCVIDFLNTLSRFEAVYGNMDPGSVRKVLPEKKILKLEGLTICIMHGYGNPKNLIPILRNEFFKEKPDIIVFGHSHNPMNETIEGVLFFNPGSATDTVFAPYRSYGIIDITEGKIRAEVVKL